MSTLKSPLNNSSSKAKFAFPKATRLPELKESKFHSLYSAAIFILFLQPSAKDLPQWDLARNRISVRTRTLHLQINTIKALYLIYLHRKECLLA